MLEGLEAVKWAELGHAYGEADDVPGLLRDLASGEDAVRDEAVYALYSNIWHQGTVYEATAYAVPFLIELVGEPTVSGRGRLLELLHALAGGSSYLDVHQHLEGYRGERETEEFQEQREQELQWVRAAHAAVVAGVPRYVALLGDAEGDVRVGASFVLTVCPERYEESAPALRQRLEREADPMAKASAVFALAQLAHKAADGDVLETVRSVVQNAGESPLVRFVAGLGAILLGGEDVLAEILPVLRETAPQTTDSIGELPWEFGETPVAALSQLLAELPNARLAWLLEMLKNPADTFRTAAIYEIGELAREYRFVAAQVVVPVARCVGDDEATVRQPAAHLLPELGRARLDAVPVLTALQNHANPHLARLATETRAKVEAPRDTYRLDNWLKKPQMLLAVDDYIAILDRNASPPDQGDAATALEVIGLPARSAAPALRRALSRESHWLRVRAARALWSVTGDPTDCLPILTEEIQCRPAGLLALDCLADMGPLAASVLPILDHIIRSPLRLVEIGSEPDWIDEDEAYQAAAQRARERITSA